MYSMCKPRAQILQTKLCYKVLESCLFRQAEGRRGHHLKLSLLARQVAKSKTKKTEEQQ